MKPAAFVVTFMAIWLGAMGLACLIILIIGIVNFRQIIETGFSPMMLTPFAAVIFGFVLFNIPFKKESQIAKDFFSTLLIGQEIK